MKKQTGIFGGSFDPPHFGHTSLIRTFLDSRILDELWIFPVPNAPHKAEMGQSDFEHRFKMAQIAFGEIPDCKIEKFEAQLPPPHFTWQTLTFLKKTYPDRNLYFCMGSDSYKNFHKWKKPDEILKLATLLVAERPGYKVENINDRVSTVVHSPTEASSTEIRELIKREEEFWQQKVHPGVAAYIIEHRLFK